MRLVGLPQMLAVSLLIGTVRGSTAYAQTITSTVLYTLATDSGNPIGIPYRSAAGGQMVGHDNGSGTHTQDAVLWDSPTGAAIDLSPTGFTYSNAFGTDGTQQVGNGLSASTGNNNHALLWTGTAASAVDLNPAGCTLSIAVGINGTQQVGSANGTSTGNNAHALLWNGTAASAVDLNPAGFTSSFAYSTNGMQQVGSGIPAATGSSSHAMLWTGTAASAVDLNPAGFTESIAKGNNGTQQVGYGFATPALTNAQALLWTGTAASAVDLTPAGFTSCFAFDTNGTQQVGAGTNSATNEIDALLWTSTAASYIDLGSTLGSSYDGSEATSISGNTIYGYAEIGNSYQAIEWTITSVPEPDFIWLIGPTTPVVLIRRRKTKALPRVTFGRFDFFLFATT